MQRFNATIRDAAGDDLEIVVVVGVRISRDGYVESELEGVRVGRRDVADTLTLEQLAQVEAAIDRRWPELLRAAERELAEDEAERQAASRRD